jgi:hypothetical protein
MILLLALACTGAPADKDTAAPDTAADTDTDTDTDADTDTDPNVDTAPVDLDGDGYAADVDCNDTNVAVYPGAPELWNERDDDCDGLVDADGAWSGSMQMAASAVYEGRRYDFSLRCPYAGTRTLGQLAFTITCTPDPEDVDAQRLLGETLIVTPKDTDVTGAAWADDVEFTSANGWDSDGEGTITWSSFSDAAVAVQMSGVSLAASGSGDIARE